MPGKPNSQNAGAGWAWETCKFTQAFCIWMHQQDTAWLRDWIHEMLTWRVTAGQLLHSDGTVWAHGYSGHREGVNNPALQSQPNVGPIPVGRWKILPAEDSPRCGVFTLPLAPELGTDTFGRSDFRIHGDLIDAPGLDLASHGCIILPRVVREQINAQADKELEVVA